MLGKADVGGQHCLATDRVGACTVPMRMAKLLRSLLWGLICRAEFGTILFWYYVADRTTVFPEMAKVSPVLCDFSSVPFPALAARTSLSVPP